MSATLSVPAPHADLMLAGPLGSFEAYADRIGRIPGVVSVTPFIWFNGIYQDPKNFFGSFPVDPVGLLDMYPEISLPAAQRKAWLETRTGAVVGRGLVDRFGWKIGDRIPLVSPIWPKGGASDTWEFEIVGIPTTLPLLREIVDEPRFRAGRYTTTYIDEVGHALATLGEA